MSEFTVPGITVSEEQSLLQKLSSGITTVPVFTGTFYSINGEIVNDPLEILNVRDMDAKVSLLPAKTLMTVTFTVNTTLTKTTAVETSAITGVVDALKKEPATGYFSLRQYFDNGGGPCFISPEAIPEALFAAPQKRLTEGKYTLNSPSLVACLGSTPPPAQLKLHNLFAVMSANKNPNPPSAQVATYFPYVETAYRMPYSAIVDEGVNVVMDGSSPLCENAQKTMMASGLSRFTLRDLRRVSPVLAAIVDADTNVIKLKKSLTEAALPAWIQVPPVGALAGVYCTTDALRGVWKAPANVALKAVRGVCTTDGTPLFVTPKILEEWFLAQVNGLRTVRGKGVTVWGARTQKGDGKPTERSVPAQRLIQQVNQQVETVIGSYIGKLNTPFTLIAVKAATDSYLHGLWQQGALAGERPGDAYRVNCEAKESTISVYVELALFTPAEYMVLSFTSNDSV